MRQTKARYYLPAERKIGVVGLYSSGKTVFLTSLINHLCEHDPDLFRIGNKGDVSIRKFRQLSTDSGWTSFDYAGFRDELVNKHRWPRKTRDRSQFVCEFERSDWWFGVRLKIYDLPGERITDALMLGCDYGEWSETVLGRFMADTHYRRICEPFLKVIEKPAVSEEDLLTEYKWTLGHLIHNYKSYVTPSSFVLDAEGGVARGSVEELVASRTCGLQRGLEFLPLPKAMREGDLGQRFRKHYDEYRNKLIRPIFESLAACDGLIVLVDVTTLLAGGLGMFEDNRRILLDLFDVLSPGESFLGQIIRKGAWWLPSLIRPNWITRLAFVVPKADLIPPKCRDNSISLMRKMIEKRARDCDRLKYDFFNCAAVVSTKQHPTQGLYLIGKPTDSPDGQRISPDSEERSIQYGEVPIDWPEDWPANRYVFPKVWPNWPARSDRPPEQLNVDRVFDFLLG